MQSYIYFLSNKAVPLVRHYVEYTCQYYSALTIWTYVNSTRVGVSFFLLHIKPSLLSTKLIRVPLCIYS